jgi:hypothetical protein
MGSAPSLAKSAAMPPSIAKPTMIIDLFHNLETYRQSAKNPSVFSEKWAFYHPFLDAFSRVLGLWNKFSIGMDDGLL